MNPRPTARRLTAAGLIIVSVGAAGTAPAMASHSGGGVENSGHCTQSTTWKLEAKPEDGRLKVDAEIDSTKNNEVWTWRILHNGGTSAHGKATTKPPSGSFEVERLLINAPGTDDIGLRAHNTVTGERCSGSVQY